MTFNEVVLVVVMVEFLEVLAVVANEVVQHSD